MKTLDFYFDYLSSYAYLAWKPLIELCEKNKLTLKLHPVLLAGLLNHWEQLGPAEIPPKRIFTLKDICRNAKLNNLPYKGPKVHPFNPLPSLRLSLPEVAGVDQLKMVDTLWSAIWGEGIDPGSQEELTKVLDKAGFNSSELLNKIQESSVKDSLREETESAINKNVFGVPTMIVDGELFWGKDQFPFIELYLDGKDPIREVNIEEILSRPQQVKRIRK